MSDTFSLFNHENHVNLFFQYLNSQHPRIKFSCGTEINNCLQFLDINITRIQNSFSATIYRKPTHTGLGLKFDSMVDTNYKTYFISCLVGRGYRICSSFDIVSAQIYFLRKYFCPNSYPVSVFEKYVGLELNFILTLLMYNCIYFC